MQQRVVLERVGGLEQVGAARGEERVQARVEVRRLRLFLVLVEHRDDEARLGAPLLQPGLDDLPDGGLHLLGVRARRQRAGQLLKRVGVGNEPRDVEPPVGGDQVGERAGDRQPARAALLQPPPEEVGKGVADGHKGLGDGVAGDLKGLGGGVARALERRLRGRLLGLLLGGGDLGDALRLGVARGRGGQAAHVHAEVVGHQPHGAAKQPADLAVDVVVLVVKLRPRVADLVGVGGAAAVGKHLQVDQPVPAGRHLGVVRARHVGPLPERGVRVARRARRVAAVDIYAQPAAARVAREDVDLAEQLVGHVHVPLLAVARGGVGDLRNRRDERRVADGVLDAVLVGGVAEHVAKVRNGAAEPAHAVVGLKVAAVGDVAVVVDVVLGKVGAAAALERVLQLAQRAEHAQRTVALERDLLVERVLVAVDLAIALPDAGGHGAALVVGVDAVEVPKLERARVPALLGLLEERLGVEDGGHEQKVAVPVGGVVERAVKGAGGALAARGGVALVGHVVLEGAARKPEHAREARLDHARRERVLVLEVRRREVGRGHGEARDVVDGAVAEARDALVAADVGAVGLRGHVGERRPELEQLLAQLLDALGVGGDQVVVGPEARGRRRRRGRVPVAAHLGQLPLDGLEVGVQVVVAAGAGAEGLDLAEDARQNNLVERHRLAERVLAADVLRRLVVARAALLGGLADVLEGLQHVLGHALVGVARNGPELGLELRGRGRVEEVGVLGEALAVVEANRLLAPVHGGGA